MFELTLFDYIYIGIVFISTTWATIRGGVYETVATLSWIASAIAARFISPLIDEKLQIWFSLSESTIGTLVASYFIVFFLILIIFGFFNNKLRDKIQESMMKLTDHTLGVIFGIIRGILIMGLVYWGMLWYYSDVNVLPTWLETARTRPIVQLTAIKIQEWFVPGESKLLEADLPNDADHMNLINPAIKTTEIKLEDEADTGYKSSERDALENQLLQIKTSAIATENMIESSEDFYDEQDILTDEIDVNEPIVLE